MQVGLLLSELLYSEVFIVTNIEIILFFTMGTCICFSFVCLLSARYLWKKYQTEHALVRNMLIWFVFLYLFGFVVALYFYVNFDRGQIVTNEYRADCVDEHSVNYDDQYVIKKPVIYLYGYDEDVVVNVKVNNGNMSLSYPVANNGSWSVRAFSDGRLKDSRGHVYKYLYWEGVGDIDYKFDSGFCFKGSDTLKFFEDCLPKLGLNSGEMDDFITYWLPYMVDNPYNVVSFETVEYEKAVTLSVTPKPDTVLRVFMIWYPSDVSVKELPLQKLGKNVSKRSGKTVVEWGGMEIDSNVISNTKSGSGEVFLSKGYKSDGTGTHPFEDYMGKTYNFTEEEWQILLNSWSWMDNPDVMIGKQTVDTLLGILEVTKK